MLCFQSSKKAGAAGLHGLNLGLGPGKPLEALGKLRAVKVHALACFDGAERGPRAVSDEAVGRVCCRGVEGAVLLSLLAV
jgi:hypothetical protein